MCNSPKKVHKWHLIAVIKNRLYPCFTSNNLSSPWRLLCSSQVCFYVQRNLALFFLYMFDDFKDTYMRSPYQGIPSSMPGFY